MKLVDNAKVAGELAPHVLEGVVSGFIIMALPVVVFSLVVGLSLTMSNVTLRGVYQPLNANSSGGMM